MAGQAVRADQVQAATVQAQHQPATSTTKSRFE
jgi:hypothetical protein